MAKKHRWHKTSHKRPEPMMGMVAGLWNEQDGRQIIEVCFYDTDDKKWYNDGGEFGIYGEYKREPDYWIEIPVAKDGGY